MGGFYIILHSYVKLPGGNLRTPVVGYFRKAQLAQCSHRYPRKTQLTTSLLSTLHSVRFTALFSSLLSSPLYGTISASEVFTSLLSRISTALFQIQSTVPSP